MQRSGKANRAVFLDRDGVINRAVIKEGLPYSPRSALELELIPGAKEAISILVDANYELVVITNQPDIARGALSVGVMEQMHSQIAKQTGIRHFFVCTHDDDDNCDCRKPRPGMLFRAARELDIDLKQSFLIGDRWKDVQAGQEAGCNCFFIDYGYLESRPSPPFCTVRSLLEATILIMERRNDG
jgi:D-glycero-D-manno-heptose 1,7-bisphosphate phosphatase